MAPRSVHNRDQGPFSVSMLDRTARLGAGLPRWLAAIILAALLAGAWVIVFESGGSQDAMPHLFYIPIILSVIPFGIWGSTGTALVATVLCGPLMPLNALTGQAQHTGSWVLRGVMFLLIGVVAYLSIAVRDRSSEQRLATEVLNAIALAAARHTEVD